MWGRFIHQYQRNYISGSWLKWQMYYSRKKPIMRAGVFSFITVALIVFIIFFWSQENVAAMKNIAGN